ncbi:MAG: hypothetical protein ACTSVV_17570 [Promethearchaeota archaeon]
MLGIKDLKEEMKEMVDQLKIMNNEISNLSEKIGNLSTELTKSMKEMTEELRNTNKTLYESLKITSEAIITMKDSFSVSLEKALDKMANMSIQMNVKDTLLKTLGLEGILPDFLKKK